MIWTLSRQEARPPTQTEKERQLADGRWGGRGGVRAKSYDSQKAWSSMNHTILSEVQALAYSICKSDMEAIGLVMF